jgi:hypothetical protein
MADSVERFGAKVNVRDLLLNSTWPKRLEVQAANVTGPKVSRLSAAESSMESLKSRCGAAGYFERPSL